MKLSENLKRVSWCQDYKLWGYCFSRSDVKEMLKYLLDNIFVKFKGKTYRQISAVLMGCDLHRF